MFWYGMMGVRFKFNRNLIYSVLSGTLHGILAEEGECQNEARVIRILRGWCDMLWHVNLRPITKTSVIIIKEEGRPSGLGEGGSLTEWFRTLDLKSRCPWLKSTISGFVLGSQVHLLDRVA